MEIETAVFRVVRLLKKPTSTISSFTIDSVTKITTFSTLHHFYYNSMKFIREINLLEILRDSMIFQRKGRNLFH